MIKHIVLLAVRETTSLAEIHDMFHALKNLQQTIPQIRSFTWGANNSPEELDRGYNYGFTMAFNTVEERNYYLTHPDHVRVADELVLPILIDGVNSALAFDYEEK